MNLNNIDNKAKGYFESKIDSIYTYHNLEHTLRVVREVMKMVKRYNLHSRDAHLMEIAAWTHDLGFSFGNFEHEIRSCEIVRQWMIEASYCPLEILLVEEMILSTRIPQQPQNLMAACLCDADLEYLSSPEYWKIAGYLMDEWVATQKFPDDPVILQKLQIDFLQKHTFQTTYGQKYFQPKKLDILEQLRQRQKRNDL